MVHSLLGYLNCSRCSSWCPK